MTFAPRAVWAGALLLALVLPIPAAAQMSFGVSGGASLATLTGDDAADELGTRTGFNVGAFAELPIGDILWLVPGLYYIQKGADSDVSTVQTIAIDYLEVPLLLRVGVSQRNPIGVDLFLGPTFAFQVKCEGRTATVDVSCEDQARPDLDLTKSFDLGLAVGAGLSFGLTPALSLLGSAMWDLGLMSIDDSAADRDIKNETILLNVGFRFTPGR